ncbi:phage baseplate assembly protein V [Streptomyces sp. NPDC059010]|uniref:phage baseplate assembly protein V n=1 Tax=Streptomyces sp. NPDC059010 TaxID=3346695 RepID=UPI00368C33DD
MARDHYGIYSGLVKDNTAGAGRLTVTVPALFEDDTVLARPALPYGVFFLPEKGCKVWVQFEGGESTLPVWTGVQQLSDEWPEPPPAGRMLLTKAGHTLHLHDKDGVTLTHHDGHAVKFTRDGASVRHGTGTAEIVLAKGNVTIKAGASSISLSADGVAISGPKITLNNGSLPLARLTDQGIGNLGAPVSLILPGNPTVLA